MDSAELDEEKATARETGKTQFTGRFPQMLASDAPAPRAADMSHDGIIAVVNGRNLYITQHSAARKNEALYRQAGRPLSWFGKHPNLRWWIVIPSRQA
jgi:hypothetical protein